MMEPLPLLCLKGFNSSFTHNLGWYWFGEIRAQWASLFKESFDWIKDEIDIF